MDSTDGANQSGEEPLKNPGWFSKIWEQIPNPWVVLKTSIKNEPAVGLALSVAGILSAAAVVRYYGYDVQRAFVYTLVWLILMTGVLIIKWIIDPPDKSKKKKDKQKALAASFALWVFLSIILLSAIMFFTAIMFGWPDRLAGILDSKKQIDQSSFEAELHDFYANKHWQYVDETFFPNQKIPDQTIDSIIRTINQPRNANSIAELAEEFYPKICPPDKFSSTTGFSQYQGPSRHDLNSWLRSMEDFEFAIDGAGPSAKSVDWWYLFLMLNDLLKSKVVFGTDEELKLFQRIMKGNDTEIQSLAVSKATRRIKEKTPELRDRLRQIHAKYASNFIGFLKDESSAMRSSNYLIDIKDIKARLRRRITIMVQSALLETVP